MTDHDNLGAIKPPGGNYVTQYSYRDPVYEGRQREFRGFRTAGTRKVGDANSPTAIARSTFLLGECIDEIRRIRWMPARRLSGGATIRARH